MTQAQYPDSNPKSRVAAQANKRSTSCIPPEALLQLGEVMALGARKYGKFNWRAETVAISVYLDAMERHRLDFIDGEDLDSESLQSHLAHVMACCGIIIDAIAQGNVIDDRHPEGIVLQHERRPNDQ